MTVIGKLGAEPPPLPSTRRIDMSTGMPVESPYVDPLRVARGITLEQAQAAAHAQTVKADAIPFEAEAKAWLRHRSYANALVGIVARLLAIEEKISANRD